MSDVLRLFLIEDDEDVAQLIRKRLERAGHRVVGCRTGADALILLAQTTFDLVILDHLLPDMRGDELLDRLNRDGVAVSVLIITGYGDEQLATRLLHAGALDYVVKDPALLFLADLPKRVIESVRRHRLERTNQLLVQALESARDGVMITDLQGTILEVNRALEKLTGYARQELIGQTPRLLRSGAQPPDFYARMWQTILARGSWQGELTNRRKDGQLRETSMTISPIVDAHGRLTHFVGIQRDITEHKQLERQVLQMQKMQSIGTLAGGIAHEFNNLMAGINGYASLGLREPDLTETLREFMQNILDLSDRAATLTRQLLAFAHKPALVRQRTSLPHLLQTTAELVRRTLHQEVTLDLGDNDGPDSPAGLLVEADTNQLQQALINLALNARHAIQERQARRRSAHWPQESVALDSAGPAPAVVFRLRRVELPTELPAFPQAVPPGDYLRVEVIDEGAGMPPAVLAQALDPFFTTKEVGQGTGLGLPLVYSIVQGHHGFLTIDSAPGSGTRVSLYLPRFVPQPVERTPPIRVGEPEVVEPDQSPGRSILVVDDEKAILDVVQRFLELAGHRVHGVTSGADAIAHVASNGALDLVILDLMLQGEDAQTTFQRIRHRLPDIPVLLCTGLTENQPLCPLLRQPRTALLRKPFRMNELWYAVKQALEGVVGPAPRETDQG